MRESCTLSTANGVANAEPASPRKAPPPPPPAPRARRDGGGDRGARAPAKAPAPRAAVDERPAQQLAEIAARGHLLQPLRSRFRIGQLAIERRGVSGLDRGDPVEVARLEIPDARRPQIRGLIRPGPEDSA